MLRSQWLVTEMDTYTVSLCSDTRPTVWQLMGTELCMIKGWPD